MIKVRGVLVALIVIAAGIGCSGQAMSPNPPPPPPAPPPPPPPGSAVVSLTTPNSDDGAVVVSLKGPGLTTMQSSASTNLFYSRAASDSEARVILVANLTGGPLFTFKVAGGKQLSAYSATVQQVATRADSLRAGTTAYSLSITAAP